MAKEVKTEEVQTEEVQTKEVQGLEGALIKEGRKNGNTTDLRMYLVLKDTNATIVRRALDKVGVKSGGYAAYLAKAVLAQLKRDMNGNQ